MKEENIKIIYIGGAARSGTTLLDLLLGELDGFLSLGEVYYIWERGVIENRLCGCGMPFKECSFWKTVVQEAFGGCKHVDAKHILELQRSVIRIRYTPQLAFPRLRTKKFTSRLNELVHILYRLYSAIAKVSGSKVLIDSSKFAPYGFVLREIPEIQLYPIHLIRDSRAVVYSLQRVKRMADIHWKEEYMPRASTLKAVQLWIIHNFLTWLLVKSSPNRRVITYESFVNHPEMVVTKIIKWASKDDIKNIPALINPHKVRLNVNHTVAGNPIRLKTGHIEIRPDVEWVVKMPLWKKLLISVLTGPFLWRRFYNSVGDEK